MHLLRQARHFGRFFKERAKTSAFKTYTQTDLENQGLTLSDGLQGLPEAMQRSLLKKGIDDLFLVQRCTFSLFAQNENELIVKSRTGTGKTLSFLLPLEYLLHHNSERSNGKVKAIILEPTRELATQVQD